MAGFSSSITFIGTKSALRKARALKETPPAKTKCRYFRDDLRSDGSASPGFRQCNRNRSKFVRLHVGSCEADHGGQIDGFDGAVHVIFRTIRPCIRSRVPLLQCGPTGWPKILGGVEEHRDSQSGRLITNHSVQYPDTDDVYHAESSPDSPPVPQIRNRRMRSNRIALRRRRSDKSTLTRCCVRSDQGSRACGYLRFRPGTPRPLR